jgi:DNA (cytosine-5)-methyltransferase 1
MSMRGYYVKNIGNNRGKPRIWIQGKEVEAAGLQTGDRFDVRVKGGAIILEARPDGTRVVSRKKKGDRELPVIDINSKELLALFDGMAAIRMVQREGEIFLMPLATELKVKERERRLQHKLATGQPLQIGSISHGGGVLSHAVHEGLAKAGIASELAFANEIRDDLIQQASDKNPAWNKDTIPLAAPIQELAFDYAAADQLPKVEVLEAGLPCSGASVSGRSARGTRHAEEHPEVGHLVVAALVIIAKVNPPIFMLENVIPYSSTASASILRNQLRDLGYNVHETQLEGQDFNELENRKRWCLMATSRGLHFDWSMLQKPEKREVALSDILDPIPEDSPMWSEMKGLKAKQERDVAAGKGFRMQVYTDDATSVGTMTKGYAKIRGTDPKLAHPTNPDLLRQFTPAENARMKNIPPELFEGLSNTIAHELLGQSVSHGAFSAVGAAIGESIKQFAAELNIDLSQPDNIQALAGAISAELQDTAAEVVGEIRRPVRGATYEGPVTVNDLGMVIQDIGQGVGILHDARVLSGDSEARLGETLVVAYPKAGTHVRVEFPDRAEVQPEAVDDLRDDPLAQVGSNTVRPTLN